MRLIDADEIKYTANGCFHPHCKEGNCDVCCHAVVRKDEIDIIPTVEAEPTGKWIKVHPIQENDVGGYKCSVCQTGFYDADRFNYCPACGAMMDGCGKALNEIVDELKTEIVVPEKFTDAALHSIADDADNHARKKINEIIECLEQIKERLDGKG